ncbi:MAG: hypothetical protein PF486_03635 [Prolixibacteraceae bacterium]|nr:hypothetical protein [Prolixibacteraceae bacterium]
MATNIQRKWVNCYIVSYNGIVAHQKKLSEETGRVEAVSWLRCLLMLSGCAGATRVSYLHTLRNTANIKAL